MGKSKFTPAEIRDIKRNQIIATVIFLVVTISPWFYITQEAEGLGDGATKGMLGLFLIWATPVIVWIYSFIQYCYFKDRESMWYVPFLLAMILIPLTIAISGLWYVANMPA